MSGHVGVRVLRAAGWEGRLPPALASSDNHITCHRRGRVRTIYQCLLPNSTGDEIDAIWHHFAPKDSAGVLKSVDVNEPKVR
jgi:hypothetical protein